MLLVTLDAILLGNSLAGKVFLVLPHSLKSLEVKIYFENEKESQ